MITSEASIRELRNLGAAHEDQVADRSVAEASAPLAYGTGTRSEEWWEHLGQDPL